MWEATSDLATSTTLRYEAMCKMWRHGNYRGESNWSTQGIVTSGGLRLVRFAEVCSVSAGVFVCFCTNRRRLGLYMYTEYLYSDAEFNSFWHMLIREYMGAM